MANKKRCETCTEECAKSKMAHEAAVGRMYATKQFVAQQKKVESGQLVEVVRCKDCRYWGDADGISTNVDGVRFARCRAHNHYVAGMHIGWCPADDDFCSYGARMDGDDDAKAD